MEWENLIGLAEKYGTPLYVYDGDLIRAKYHELRSYFPCAGLEIFYAMKANYNPAILRLLEREGARIDAVSPGDVLLAMKTGFSADRILFTANKITDEEMHLVKSTGVLFNIGSLSRLERYGAAFPGSEVCIRFNPVVEAGEHEMVRTGGESSKFGIRIDHLDTVKDIVARHSLKVVGLHEHTGSGIPETVQMLEGMTNIVELAIPEHFPELRFVDFGGGFKVAFKPGESVPDYADFGQATVELFDRTRQIYGREIGLYFEPGKFLVSEAGQLVVEVTTIKKNPDKLIAGSSSGFPQLIRPMFYQAYHHVLNLTNPSGPTRRYDVVGNICESGDCFAVDRDLPELREGDLIAILNAGAYCYSMGGVYNLRPMPAEVLIEGGKPRLVRRRLGFDELVQQILDESA